MQRGQSICCKRFQERQCTEILPRALALDPDNFKVGSLSASSHDVAHVFSWQAAFRKAQATVRLGEVTRGRDLLLELQKKQNGQCVSTRMRNYADEQWKQMLESKAS